MNLNTVLVFDWDDTLFPTSYIQKKYGGSFKDALNAEPNHFSALDSLVATIISSNLDKYICILTCSGYGWVKLCCWMLYPKTAQLLEFTTILHAHHLTGSKSRVLSKQIVLRYYIYKINGVKQIIALGDHRSDREAVLCAGGCFPDILTKNIYMFEESPIDKLYYKLEYFSKKLDEISAKCEHLDLQIGMVIVPTPNPDN